MFGGGGGGYRPAETPAPPKETDEQVQKRRAARLTAQRYRQGYASTIASDRASNQQALGGTGTQGMSPGASGSVTKLG